MLLLDSICSKIGLGPRDLGILLRLLEYRLNLQYTTNILQQSLMYQALSNFETATDQIDKIRTFISES